MCCMTEPRGRDHPEGDTADFGRAITRLQESMVELSAGMSELGEATARLQSSARELSEKQGEISEQMGRTAAEIRDATGGPEPHAGGARTAAPADD